MLVANEAYAWQSICSAPQFMHSQKSQLGIHSLNGHWQCCILWTCKHAPSGQLSVISYTYRSWMLPPRSLEKVLCSHTVPFQPLVSDAAVSSEELAHVDKVLTECKEPDYWFAASRDGNRESHYRGQALYDVALLNCDCVSPCGGLPKGEQADESQDLCVIWLAGGQLHKLLHVCCAAYQANLCEPQQVRHGPCTRQKDAAELCS